MAERKLTREHIVKLVGHSNPDIRVLAHFGLYMLDLANTAHAKLAEAEREGEEQARLLGISGSREAKLLADLAARDRTIAELRTKIANMEDLWGFELLPNGGTRAKAIGKTLKYLANEAVTQHVAELEAKLAEQAARIATLEEDKAHWVKLYEEAASRRIDESKALADARRDAERLRAAVLWALGEMDDFPPREAGDGAYWWRTELRRRAALAQPATREGE